MQRYDAALNGTAFMGMVEIEQGRYVLSSDAQTEIDRLKEQLEALQFTTVQNGIIGEQKAEIDRLTDLLKKSEEEMLFWRKEFRMMNAAEIKAEERIKELEAERDRLREVLKNIANDDMAVCDSCDAYQESARAALERKEAKDGR